nr:hypothetical protein CFP56_21130 [Quercus suber]
MDSEIRVTSVNVDDGEGDEDEENDRGMFGSSLSLRVCMIASPIQILGRGKGRRASVLLSSFAASEI